MKITNYILCLILVASSFAVSAQENVRTVAETQKVTNIRKLLDLTGSGKLGVQVIQTMFSNFKTSYPNVDTAFWDDFLKEVKAEDLVNMIIPIYNRNFSSEEIDGMLAFYSSPIGRQVLQKLPVIMQQSMQVGKDWGGEIYKKVLLKLQQKGYIKEG